MLTLSMPLLIHQAVMCQPALMHNYSTNSRFAPSKGLPRSAAKVTKVPQPNQPWFQHDLTLVFLETCQVLWSSLTSMQPWDK